MKYEVEVLHNVSTDMFIRFSPETSKLYHAFTFEVEAIDMEGAANIVWALANVDDADALTRFHPNLAHLAPQVTQYRECMNRSLSVSDVLAFRCEGEYAGALAVEMIGHRELDKKPAFEPSRSWPSASFDAHQRFMEEQNGRQ